MGTNIGNENYLIHFLQNWDGTQHSFCEGIVEMRKRGIDKRFLMACATKCYPCQKFTQADIHDICREKSYHLKVVRRRNNDGGKGVGTVHVFVVDEDGNEYRLFFKRKESLLLYVTCVMVGCLTTDTLGRMKPFLERLYDAIICIGTEKSEEQGRQIINRLCLGSDIDAVIVEKYETNGMTREKKEHRAVLDYFSRVKNNLNIDLRTSLKPYLDDYEQLLMRGERGEKRTVNVSSIELPDDIDEEKLRSYIPRPGRFAPLIQQHIDFLRKKQNRNAHLSKEILNTAFHQSL